MLWNPPDAMGAKLREDAVNNFAPCNSAFPGFLRRVNFACTAPTRTLPGGAMSLAATHLVFTGTMQMKRDEARSKAQASAP